MSSSLWVALTFALVGCHEPAPSTAGIDLTVSHDLAVAIDQLEVAVYNEGRAVVGPDRRPNKAGQALPKSSRVLMQIERVPDDAIVDVVVVGLWQGDERSRGQEVVTLRSGEYVTVKVALEAQVSWSDGGSPDGPGEDVGKDAGEDAACIKSTAFTSFPDGLDQDCDGEVDENEAVAEKTCMSTSYRRVRKSALESECDEYCGADGTLTCTSEESVTLADQYLAYDFLTCTATSFDITNSAPRCHIWNTEYSVTCTCPAKYR